MAKSDNTAPVVLKPESVNPLAGIKTMSSKEVAELTGKLHKNVVRDIREMLKELDGSNLSHEEYQELTDARGYTQEFLLNEELTLTLVSGYNVKMRNAIIKRWKELEAGESPKGQTIPLASCTPIVFHGTAILMLHRPNKDWISFQSLCQLMELDYRHHYRVVREAGCLMEDIAVTGDKVTCISYESALKWLQSINPEKIRLNKRHKVVGVMLQLPQLLTEARNAYLNAKKGKGKKPKQAAPQAAAIRTEDKYAGKVVSHAMIVLAYEDGASESLPVNEVTVNSTFRKLGVDAATVGLSRFNEGLKYFYEASREGIALYHDIDRTVNGDDSAMGRLTAQ